LKKLKRGLQSFFADQKPEFTRFGSTINQTFEAFVLAQVIGWYKARGWDVKIVNPTAKGTDRKEFKLKFNTRGHPGAYSYAVCVAPDGSDIIQIRHQLRLATRHFVEGDSPHANICLDIAVIRDTSVDGLRTDDHVPNQHLVTFGEAKHMSAFAELVAGFVGMVHELQPERLKRRPRKAKAQTENPAPFLFVSGRSWITAEGIIKTMKRRRMDLGVFNRTNLLSEALGLPTDNQPKKARRQKRPPVLHR
jgi:hypothetical protein